MDENKITSFEFFGKKKKYLLNSEKNFKNVDEKKNTIKLKTIKFINSIFHTEVFLWIVKLKYSPIITTGYQGVEFKLQQVCLYYYTLFIINQDFYWDYCVDCKSIILPTMMI